MLLFDSTEAVFHCIAFHYTRTVSEGCNAFEVKVGHFRMQLLRVCIFSFALKEQAVSWSTYSCVKKEPMLHPTVCAFGYSALSQSCKVAALVLLV